jgi:hypothetical protein
MARVRNPTVRGVLPGGKATGEREALERIFRFSVFGCPLYKDRFS